MKILTKEKRITKFDPVRAAALKALVLIDQGEQTDRAVELVKEGEKLRPIDSKFLMQLVAGTTKMKRRLDHELKFYLAKPSIDLPLLLSNIFRLGFFQLHFTDRIPDAAIVSESVNLAHRFLDRPRANLINAVLRTAIREPHKISFPDKKDDPVSYYGKYYSYPDHFVKYCLDEFSEKETENILIKYNLSPTVTYRVNFLKAKPEEVKKTLKEYNVAFSDGKFLPEFIHIDQGGIPLEKELIESGKVFIQDESAGLAGRLLNPKQGSKVVDLTAAPGGKATHIAIKMRNKGRVTALDKSDRRLQLLVKNVNRLGIKIISPVVCDMAEFIVDPFDRVILDPPCTGWGTAGKHSDLRWAKTENDIKNLSKVQGKMIDRAGRPNVNFRLSEHRQIPSKYRPSNVQPK